MSMYDMHCHLDFCDNCKQIAEETEGKIEAVDSTVIPSSFVSARAKLEPFSNIKVALGLHPWWIANGRAGEADVASFENLVRETNAIGEIGLDFHRKYQESKNKQLDFFTRCVEAIKESGNNKIIFLHVVKAYEQTIDLLDLYRIFENNTVVFHSFSGTPEDFGLALSKDCLFTIGMRTLSNDMGRFFVTEIPEDRLLAETDSPANDGDIWSAGSWEQTLHNVIKSIAELRKSSFADTLELLNENSKPIFDRI